MLERTNDPSPLPRLPPQKKITAIPNSCSGKLFLRERGPPQGNLYARRSQRIEGSKG
jgi:hypothetical protein